MAPWPRSTSWSSRPREAEVPEWLSGVRAFGAEPRRGLPFAVSADVRRIATLLVLIAVVAAVFGYLTPHFVTANSVVSIARQTTVLLIVAVGVTFVITAGEIDLSVGAVVALVSVLAAWLIRNDYSLAVMLIAAVATGALVGAVNGFLAVKLRVPSFLATLGTLSVGYGAAMTISLQPIPMRSLDFVRFFRLSPGGVPMPVILALAVVVASVLLFSFSRFGVRTRAVGSNQQAARLAGVNTARHRFVVLVLCSVFAALGGLVFVGRTNYGMAQAAHGLELQAIAAALLGGARLGGGTGSMVGTLLAALLLTMIFVGIATVGLPGPYQDIAKGAAIGLAVLMMRRKRSV